MLFKKITVGQVEQLFNDAGECVSQQFISNDEEYGFEYDMVQPNSSCTK